MRSCKKQVLARDEPVSAISSAPPDERLAHRKGYVITCLDIEFEASGHCIALYQT